MSNSEGVRIEAARAATDEVRELIRELDRVLSAEYPPEQRHGLDLDAIFQPHIRFLMPRLNGEAVGCGGVALFADFAEAKRMYVRDGARRKGVAQALLARIEMETLAAGLAVLRLETGVRQERAIRLYMRSGFRRCPAFGAYVMMAAEAISTSVFFEKLLATTARSQVEIASSLRSSQ
jgi:putative acetyltransferase